MLFDLRRKLTTTEYSEQNGKTQNGNEIMLEIEHKLEEHFR
jgi:hypothetical protein